MSQPNPVWVHQLKADIDQELSDKPAIATLATVRQVAGEPWPDARSVIVRGLDASGQIVMTSDHRSQKNQQLRQSPRATLVIWLANLKRQYRLDVLAQVIGTDDNDPVRELLWKKSSPASQAMFYWPAPGAPIEPIAPAVLISGTVPDDFEVIRLTPTAVQFLDLKPNPHDRRIWNLESGIGSSAG